MKRLNINGLHLWQFDNLSAEKRVRHYVSDRDSAGPENDFTLSFSSSEDKDQIRANRQQIAHAMGTETARILFPSQVHKTRVTIVKTGIAKDELMETDGLITIETGICISVMSADCVPILLYDRKNHVGAAIHSGWRGTVAKIVEGSLQRLHNEFGTQGKDIIAGIGPSVSQESYEVGDEVEEAVTHAFGAGSGLMVRQPNKKVKLDLWKANTIQLQEFGVPAKQIEVSDLCTVKNNNYFYSARKGDAGRFAAGILLL
jgi:polyphenol oxidase